MTWFFVDLRSALRRWGRNRGLTIVALTSLAVAIGVSAAIMSVSNAVLVRPLPYEKPDELVMVWARGAGRPTLTGFLDQRRLIRRTVTPGMLLQWRGKELPFTDFAVLESWQTGAAADVDLSHGTGVERLRGTLATANLFEVLGVRAALGRTFREADTGVALISNALWRRKFGADPGIIGQTVSVAAGRDRYRELVEIVGVLPEHFRFDYPDETEIWLLLTWQAIDRTPHVAASYRAVARLQTGNSVAAAEVAMQAFRDPAQKHSQTPERLWLEPMHDYVVGPSRAPLVLVSALALVVMVSGAVNAATVFAASAVSRLGDVRVHRALGASQSSLVRQVFTEVGALATLAGVIGVMTVSLALPVIRALLPAGLPRSDEIRLDAVTLFGVGVAVVLSTGLAALLPAWFSLRTQHELRLGDLRGATISPAGLRLRVVLLSAQFALVSALLVSGGMLVRSFWNIMHVDKGFDADPNVYVADLQLLHPTYRGNVSRTYEKELIRRVRELSYVESVGVTSAVPLHGADSIRRVQGTDGQMIQANARMVDPGYFEVMRIPLLNGRAFTDADDQDTGRVALVSHSLAETIYPGQSPLGKPLWGADATIVGVVSDVRARSLLEVPMPAFYLSWAQERSSLVYLLLRTGTGAQRIGADVREIVAGVYPEQPMPRIANLEQFVERSVSDRRAYAFLASAFAVVMLVLAGLGVCGHLSHVVVERSRDLVLRAALGASSTQQLLVLLRQIIPALTFGLFVAPLVVYLSFPLLDPFLFEIGRLDTVSCAASGLLVAIFTVAAMIMPVRRILAFDPAAVLREM